jgi:hypothetical protein
MQSVYQFQSIVTENQKHEAGIRAYLYVISCLSVSYSTVKLR